MRDDAKLIEGSRGGGPARMVCRGAMTLLGYHVRKALCSADGKPRHLQRPGKRRPTRAVAAKQCAISTAAGDVPLMPRPSASRPSTGAYRLTWWWCRSAKAARLRALVSMLALDQRRAARAAREGAGPARAAEAARPGFRVRSKGPSGKALRHAVASLPRDL